MYSPDEKSYCKSANIMQPFSIATATRTQIWPTRKKANGNLSIIIEQT